MTSTIDDLAQFIRRVDGDNRMSAEKLGSNLALRLCTNPYGDPWANDVIAFVERTNPDKKMGAGHLAELIVAEFELNEEG